MQNYVWTFLVHVHPSSCFSLYPTVSFASPFHPPTLKTNSRPFRGREAGREFSSSRANKTKNCRGFLPALFASPRPEHRDKRGVMPRYLHIKFAPSSVPLYSNDYSSSFALDSGEGREEGERMPISLSLSLSLSLVDFNVTIRDSELDTSTSH